MSSLRLVRGAATKILSTSSSLRSAAIFQTEIHQRCPVAVIAPLQQQQQQQQQQIRSMMSDAADGPKQRTSKVKKKEKKSSDSGGGGGGRSRDVEILLACLDAPKKKLPPTTEFTDQQKSLLERREEILKNYTVGKFKQHNEENHDIACKLKMKQHALRMLPKNSTLKEKALEVDEKSFPPRWRKIPAWTPPIPNFNPSEFMVTEE